MVGQKRSQADGERGGREEEEQDVELSLSVWEAVLRGSNRINRADTLRLWDLRDFYSTGVLEELIKEILHL